MCTRVTCPRCGRATWIGCGRHVEEVLRGVPPAQRCQCERERPVPFWKRLFGRRP